jgi:hypothetical protein
MFNGEIQQKKRLTVQEILEPPAYELSKAEDLYVRDLLPCPGYGI